MSNQVNVWFIISPSGGGNPTEPGDGWGGDIIPTDSAENVTVYSWDKDDAVTFTAINQTIVVDPRSYSEDTAGAQSAADDYCAEATTLQGGGFKAGFRYWKEDTIADGDILRGDWWDTIEPYEAIPIDATLQSWWDDFNARVIANAVTPDYKIHDFEEGVGYYELPDQATRQTYLEPITIDDASNPYPNDPNPYIGENIWSYSSTSTGPFLSEFNQDAVERRTTFLKALTEDCPVANNQYSNYNDYLQSYEIGNLAGYPDRNPGAQTRLAGISAMPVYLDYNASGQSLTDPEPEYTSARQMVNRRRFKKYVWRHNSVKSALAAGSDVHPWIAPPGYGANGANTWASTTIMPFEKLLWRIKMRHLMALGLNTFILWNPASSNPNSEDGDTFMDAYFTDLKVRSGLSQSVGLTPMDADEIVTNDRITTYDDIYRLTSVYWSESGTSIEPFSQGFGTPAEPLILNPGATGTAELAAFTAALEVVYGTDEDDPDAYVVPSTFERTGFVPAPS